MTNSFVHLTPEMHLEVSDFPSGDAYGMDKEAEALSMTLSDSSSSQLSSDLYLVTHTNFWDFRLLGSIRGFLSCAYLVSSKEG